MLYTDAYHFYPNPLLLTNVIPPPAFLWVNMPACLPCFLLLCLGDHVLLMSARQDLGTSVFHDSDDRQTGKTSREEEEEEEEEKKEEEEETTITTSLHYTFPCLACLRQGWKKREGLEEEEDRDWGHGTWREGQGDWRHGMSVMACLALAGISLFITFYTLITYLPLLSLSLSPVTQCSPLITFVCVCAGSNSEAAGTH